MREIEVAALKGGELFHLFRNLRERERERERENENEKSSEKRERKSIIYNMATYLLFESFFFLTCLFELCLQFR